ncbi:MAG TPA: cytochrome bc complex cytochrome b subunit, partial [Nitrososphaeraceae archaeon]|nr:cytochrome bc complex cytochrome b subunit [Nitrososphaeraceae archaeon]
IFILLIIPFIDRYKKFSWKDRPIITAIGITSLAQIIVTTYWGFYIDPDRTKSLLERLVIDPVFLYLVMILLVPLSFGFTYMMIKLAKNAEANAKLQPKKSTGKGSINLSEKSLYAIFIALLAFQVYLNIAAYYAVLNGMKNYSLFIVGIIMLVFAGMFHIYRHGKTMQKAPPPKPTVPPMPMKAKPPSLTKTGAAAEQLAAGSKALEDSVPAEKKLAPTQSGTSSSQSVKSVNKTESTGTVQGEQRLVSDEKK